jgi:serine/threonine-protein kinase
VIGVLLGVLSWQFVRGQATVPNLVGQDIEVAVQSARDQKLMLEPITPIYDENQAPGVVLRQDVAPDDKVRGYTSVAVEVSAGPAPRVMPATVGATEAEATAALTSRGLVPNVTRAFDESIEAGRVISQDPAADQGGLERGQTVSIVVSDGPAPRLIPASTGKTIAQLSEELTALGLVPQRVDVFNDAEVGSIVGLEPGVGATAPRGSTVKILVSKGPDLVSVPNVVGKTPAQARSALQGAGFAVQSFGPSDASVVLATRPAAGSQAKRGATIQVIAA